MTAEQKTSVQNSIGRLVFVGLCILLEVLWIVLLYIRLNEYSAILSAVTRLAALVIVLKLYGKHTNAAFKMPWMLLLLAFPVLGVCLYLLMGRSGATRRMARRFEAVHQTLAKGVPVRPDVVEELKAQGGPAGNLAGYLQRYGGFPLCRNTDVDFYADAADGLEAQLRDLERAERFIFMEYHAVQEGAAFGRLKDVLARKAAQGVEVRFIYDDIGSIGFINRDFIRRMEQVGVQCRVFNPVIPVFNVFLNNRDHRKITVIDGAVGFTGGYNLADEYFNLTHPFGRWKDTGIRLEGDAVTSLTAQFLEMWNAIRPTDGDVSAYLAPVPYQSREGGFVQPYADSPLDQEFVGENVYLSMAEGARERVWFTTPYLIISDEMNRALGLAARRGVDVRIITPGIPDKKLVYSVTRSYYAGLARSGVRIYEYTPGFIHAKQCVADGETAVVGTINMDYRSLYLHFENAVLFHGCAAVKQVEEDFRNTFPQCREVTGQYSSGRSAVLRVGQCLLRLFAPLL
ncbi:cardiolipin synthase [Pseudoflavonifractor intestinihominis]|uniref:Cardiolipin synthase n=1 Tax=Pseudoflavonifractor intestinihominis TaxID=3133171 RepID=A0ABV1E9K6_9FIRM|nr:cardiolipin synthase [uncultured Pseudoflavonifractor sp.]